jgi:predicted RNase H-like HicB family nuclease
MKKMSNTLELKEYVDDGTYCVEVSTLEGIVDGCGDSEAAALREWIKSFLFHIECHHKEGTLNKFWEKRFKEARND